MGRLKSLGKKKRRTKRKSVVTTRGDFVLVRRVLGNEVYRDRKTGKEYLVQWSEKGKPRFKQV